MFTSKSFFFWWAVNDVIKPLNYSKDARQHNVDALAGLVSGANIFGYSAIEMDAIGRKIDRLAKLMRCDPYDENFYDNLVSNLRRNKYGWLRADWTAITRVQSLSIRDPLEFISGGFDWFRDDDYVIYWKGKDFHPLYITEGGSKTLSLTAYCYPPGIHESRHVDEITHLEAEGAELILFNSITRCDSGRKNTRHLLIDFYHQTDVGEHEHCVAKCYINPVQRVSKVTNAFGTKR